MQSVASASFYQVLTEAVDDFAARGYDSEHRIAAWLQRLHDAARREMMSDREVDARLRATLGTVYQRLVERGGILQRHPGLARYTLERVKPKLRAELDRRIMASARLIKLNRDEAVQQTLRRFSGWATSLPLGGGPVDRVPVKSEVRKPLASLPFVERRVAIDQGHKFTGAISDILATDGGALAAVWHSHWRQANYNYREDHKERDGRIYAVRGNWAIRQGLMRAGPDGYIDSIDKPGTAVYCRCYFTYLYSLRALPPGMVTAKGLAEATRVRGLVA